MITKETSPITFVTAFYKLYEEEPYEHKTIEWRIENFRVLAKSGIKIIIYSCEKTKEYISNLCDEFPANLFHGNLLIPYEETDIYKMSMKKDDEGSPLELPSNRNSQKDTYEYLTLMNCKIEFVRDAILQNPWGSLYFAWMDFSMAYLFSNKEETSKKMLGLNELSHFSVACEGEHNSIKKMNKVLAFPGCWSKISSNYYLMVKDNICWRFCGTFFLGDKESILEMYQFYIEHYPRFIKETNKLTWEVNIWAWLEANTLWTPQWYSSDHNDRLITDLVAFLGEPSIEESV